MLEAVTDPFDRRLLTRIQRSVPLVREPFAQLAGELGCAERHVLSRLAELSGPGRIVREVSGIFDASALGYEQALVAFRLAEGRLDAGGAQVAAHPGVSHCYQRTGRYNLWFTLAVSPSSRLGFGRTVQRLAERTGAEEHIALPARKRYKLAVRFGDAAGDDVEPAPAEARPVTPGGELAKGPGPAPSDEQRRAIRALQVDLPRRPDPFSPLAEQAGLDPDMLLVHGADFLAAGWMRRYAAVLHHRAAGAASNVLAAWRVDERLADAAGAVCARHSAVSHCYLRASAEGWPYNLYTMIHGRTREDCQRAIAELAAGTGLRDPVGLWTGKEFAKRRIELFSEAEQRWESGR